MIRQNSAKQMGYIRVGKSLNIELSVYNIEDA